MSVLAQNNTGIISGRIMDQTGALVPNAQITVTQTETGVDSISQSNSEGLYRVPGLRDGPYKVTVTAAGFKKTVREGFDLQIGQILDVEIKLEVGNVTESVTVTNSIPLLDTQTSSTGQVMEGSYFYELPNYQHWEKGVLYYTPQVGSTNAPWPGSLGNWNINGANSYQTATYEDGMLSTSMDGGTTINSVSVADEEVKVLTSAMPAEYGHATAGALIVVKKGGTNEFHGEGGELFKNNPLVHRRFFQLQTNPQQNISDLFQMPDFVVSGPVIIPKIYNGRNKTFFEIGGSYHVDSSSNAAAIRPPPPQCWPATSVRSPTRSTIRPRPAGVSPAATYRARPSRGISFPRAGSARCGMPSRPTIHSWRPRRAPAALPIPDPAETSWPPEREITLI